MKRFLLLSIGILMVLSGCEFGQNERADSRRGRYETARARTSYYYGQPLYSDNTRFCEKELADKMKTWDNYGQIIPWQDVADSIYRGEYDTNAYWHASVLRDTKKCRACHDKLVRIYYRQKAYNTHEGKEGWLIVCLNCRKQVKFEPTK